MTGRSQYTHQRARLTLRSRHQSGEPDGVWWPRSRNLGVELPQLIASWPADVGRIGRVLYSAPDWDDQPRSVRAPGHPGPVETGSFVSDGSQLLALILLDGTRRSLTVVPSGTPADDAARLLAHG